MNWWQKVEAWSKSWEGIMAAIGAAVLAIASTWKHVLNGGKRIIAVVRFFLNLDKHHDDIVERLKSLDRGQLHMIQTRRILLDRESASAFFECDPKGGCIWVSRLWRRITGLDSDDARGNGWELGIAEENRAHISNLWQEAITKSRPFEAVVIYADRDGLKTSMKVFASPIQDETTREVLGWFGSAMK